MTLSVTTMLAFQGVSKEDAKIALSLAMVQETNLKDGFSNFDVKRRPFLKVICRHLVTQKKRLGGNFAVAHAVSHRKVFEHRF